MTFQPWIPQNQDILKELRKILQWSHDLSAMDTWMTEEQALADVDLQWSHDLSAMDTLLSPAGAIFYNHLQWSHDLSAMDTCPWVDATGNAVPESFNGAMTFQPWIPGWCAICRASTPTFNGAMTFQPWIHVAETQFRHQLRPSMEP